MLSLGISLVRMVSNLKNYVFKTIKGSGQSGADNLYASDGTTTFRAREES